MEAEILEVLKSIDTTLLYIFINLGFFTGIVLAKIWKKGL